MLNVETTLFTWPPPLALLLTVLFILLSLIATSRFYNNNNNNKHEPPELPSLLPYFGHLINFLRRSDEFFKNAFMKHGLPIYTLKLPGSRIYVVNSADVVLSLQKLPEAISFWSLEGRFTAKLGGLDSRSRDILIEGVSTNPRGSFLVGGLKAIQQAMKPGKNVYQMVEASAITMYQTVQELYQGEDIKRIDLWEWVKHEITIGTTDAIYGPQNPYRSAEIENNFWAIANHTIGILMSPLPRFTSSKAYHARIKVNSALQSYYRSGGHEKGSQIVQTRYRITETQFPLVDVAGFEITNGFAMLTNTAPTAFWTLWHVFSNPELLNDVRKEALSMTEATSDDNLQGNQRCPCHVLDLRRLSEATVINRVVMEVLRYRGQGVNPRHVVKDTWVDGKYMLKKDAVVLISTHEIHHDQQTWGADAREFNPDRFKHPVHPEAFRGFGGGMNRCPGKGYAMAEISIFIILLALHFDIKPVGGVWMDPGDRGNTVPVVGEPVNGYMVDLVPLKDRKGLWQFRI